MKHLLRLCLLSLLLSAALIPPGRAASAATPVSIYGAWHCGDDACTWATTRSIAEFDSKNHWLIDRGDGSGLPSVNLVVLSFVHHSLKSGSVNWRRC